VISEVQLELVSVGEDITGGQAHDAAQGLGVEQHQHRGHPCPERGGVVGEQAAQQTDPVVLGDRRPPGRLMTGDVQAGHASGAHGPL